MPRTSDGWKEVAHGYNTRWNYPLCLGSLDGKHIRISKPPHSGSLFYNYKGYYSVILFALVSATYDILYIDLGTEGRISDSGIWSCCALQKHLRRGSLNLPQPEPIPNTSVSLPYHFVGDDAFPLDQHLMKPYGHRALSHKQCVFNYRLSRARRTVENVFGIMASRFRVLHTEIRVKLSTVKKVVSAICILHNILNRRSGSVYLNTGSVDQEDCNFEVVGGEWRSDKTLHGIRCGQARNAKDVAKLQRDTLCDYFNSTRGSVPWQNERVNIEYGDM